MKNITGENEFEIYIRNLLQIEIVNKHNDFILLENKKAVDIILARNSNPPQLYFFEIKFKTHHRMGFGSKGGKGFQPEILTKRIDYFENNLRWIIGNQDLEKSLFLTNSEVRNYIMGGSIGLKHNNFIPSIFKKENCHDCNSLINEIKIWLGVM